MEEILAALFLGRIFPTAKHIASSGGQIVMKLGEHSD